MKRILKILTIVSFIFGLLINIDNDIKAASITYVSNIGDDTLGNGTTSNPYATVSKAVSETDDGGEIIIKSDLLVTKSARFYDKSLTIKSDNSGPYTLSRGTGFEGLSDNYRSWYNPAMFEMGITNGLSYELVIDNVIIDEQGLHEGTVFKQNGDKNYNANLDIYHDSVIASYSPTGTITLKNSKILNYGGYSAILSKSAKVNVKNSVIEDTLPATSFDNRGVGAILIQQSGSLNFAADSKIANLVSSTNKNVRAIYVEHNSNAIISGEISNNGSSNNKANMIVISKSTATIEETSIIKNNNTWAGTVYVVNGANVIVKGKIQNNKSIDRGGGLYIVTNGAASHATLENTGEISGNSSTRTGGGVELQQGTSSFTMNGGKIINNTAISGGGAIAIGKGNAKFIMNGGEISGNTSIGKVGGVYLYSEKVNVNINSGSILNNKANGKATDVGIEKATIVNHGDMIDHHVKVNKNAVIDTGVYMLQEDKYVSHNLQNDYLMLGNLHKDTKTLLIDELNSKTEITKDEVKVASLPAIYTLWVKAGSKNVTSFDLSLPSAADPSLAYYVAIIPTDATGVAISGSKVEYYKAKLENGKVLVKFNSSNTNGYGVALTQAKDIPVTDENGGTKDEPKVPDVPKKPDVPDAPDTGNNLLTYSLMSMAVALLVSTYMFRRIKL
ncbi:hypothetical protein OKW22_000053 [Bacilli bacterium PM5-3]|nr:hypothetical protein [Bacilli bacterium PM5-3]MDH6604330.1 hypothetical protein [Bacilli bacterium PM5-9]